jgi:hypothetical protein
MMSFLDDAGAASMTRTSVAVHSTSRVRAMARPTRDVSDMKIVTVIACATARVTTRTRPSRPTSERGTNLLRMRLLMTRFS